jgi:hypothetical protein
MIVASSLMFFQCTSEYTPITGADGLDGIDGIDGVDGTASCVACHSASHRDPINDAYALSAHGNPSILWNGQSLPEYTNRTYCTQCHSNEGYVEYQETGAIQAAYAIPTALSCTGCHSDHETFDFENDGQDYALRNIEPLQLMVDDTYHIDYGNTSNACISCHQPRRFGPTDDGFGTFTVTSSHWGPHYGAQSTVLEGIGGALIAGSMGYPGIASAAHRTGASCVSCHMGETTDTSDGSHTMVPTENACTTCHSNGVPTEVSGLAADLITLAGLLENVVGWEYQYEVDINGDLVEDINGDPIIVLDINGDPVTLEVIGILVGGSPNTGSFGEGATFTIIEAQAAWNYRYLYQDHSQGIHNPDYAKALIVNSIEALQD